MTAWTPKQIVATACAWLKLPKRETDLLRDCTSSWTRVGIGNFLASPGYVPAAERLIAKGYLTKSKDQPTPYDPKGLGMVVVMTDENSNKLVTDANATRTGANQPSRTGKEPRSQADG